MSCRFRPASLMEILMRLVSVILTTCGSTLVLIKQNSKAIIKSTRVTSSQSKFIPIKINASHNKLKKRCEYMKGFCKQYEQLRIMNGHHQGISRLDLGPSAAVGARDVGDSHLGELTNSDKEEEVWAAYESVKNVDVLDASPGMPHLSINQYRCACPNHLLSPPTPTEGTQIWTTAEAADNERVSCVENQIIARLRGRLGSARNATEMFRFVDSVFSKIH